MSWISNLAGKKRRIEESGGDFFERHAPRKSSWKHLEPKRLKELRNLLFTARTIVEGAYSGRHRSPFRGASPEFVDYREYYPGDELRSIDWKAVARSDRLFIRLFEKHTDMNVNLMVDASASMGYGGEPGAPLLDHANLSKLDYALCLAAAISYVSVKQSDKTGLTIFDDRIRYHIQPGGTFSHLYSMLGRMERQQAGRQTNAADALRKSYPLFRRRGLLIIISDFIEDSAELFKAMNLYRHRGFEIIMLHVLHRDELELPADSNINFIDSENGEIVNSRPSEIRDSYRRQVDAWLEELRSGARACRIDYRLISTDTPFQLALRDYLLSRADSRLWAA